MTPAGLIAVRQGLSCLRFLSLFPLLVVLVRAEEPPCPPPASKISVSHGWFEPSPDIRYRLTNFQATLLSKAKAAPLCYGRITVVSQGQIFVSNESLTSIFSQKLRNSGSKIKNLEIRNGPAGATLIGSITKVVPIHFSIEGPVTTDGSEIRLTARSIKADGMPVKDLLKLVGAELNSILQLRGMPGITIEDNALSFSPEKVANLRGHITSVTTSSHGLTLLYGSALLSSQDHPIAH